MNKISYENIDLDVYTEVLDNGLRVFLIKIPRNEIHARITALYGGSILEFKTKGDKEFTKVPAGIAHFLEHKMFEKKDFDPFQIYEKNGASANAFTTEKITSYHFTGIHNFYENLNILLRCVHEPYFTDENINKEKGIISQEKMEDLDSVYYITRDKAFENTFKNSGFKNSILGSLEDINNMTKEELYKVYNTFYHPSNMLLTISGGIDIEETMKFIKDYYSKKDFGPKKEIILKEIDEPKTVVKEKEIIYKDVKSKEIYINYKIKKNDKMKDKFKNICFLNMFLHMNFGGFSPLSDITFKDKNYLSPINNSLLVADDFYILQFNITAKDDADAVIELIDDTLNQKKTNENTFNLLKKNDISSLIVSTENAKTICHRIISQIRNYGKLITDIHSRLINLEYSDFKEIINSLDLSNRAVVILESKKDD
ncbi:MAG: insulinase family protein [Bacilli bacterium]|nr:insulinase family protein [Bacilli bacterium]